MEMNETSWLRQSQPNINSGFWISDFGLPIPEFARLPAIESVALFPRTDIRFSNGRAHYTSERFKSFG
jgi:hypothetical protein